MGDPLERRAAQARVRVARASLALRTAQTARDELVADMLTAGWSLTRIAAALDVSKARAQQIAERVRL